MIEGYYLCLTVNVCEVLLSRKVASQPVYILDPVVNNVTYGLPMWSSG